MVGSFARVMNLVDAGVNGGRTLMPIRGTRNITRNVRENAPRKKRSVSSDLWRTDVIVCLRQGEASCITKSGLGGGDVAARVYDRLANARCRRVGISEDSTRNDLPLLSAPSYAA